MRKQNGRILSACIILTATALMMASCKKQDGLSKDELYVYTPPGNNAYNVLLGKSYTLIGSTILSETDLAFPVALTRPYQQDVEVSAIIDTGYIKVYDSIYSPSSPSLSLPKGRFTLVNDGKTVIKAGELYSADSIKIQLKDPSNMPIGSTTFLVPVVLKMASNGVPVSTTRQVMYMPVTLMSVAKGITSLAGTNNTSVRIKNTAGQYTGPNAAYLKGILNYAIPADEKVTIKENLSLVSAYNQENGTNFLPFPSGSFQIVKNEVTVPGGKTSSADSIEIKLPDPSKFEVEKNYLLPVELANNNNASSVPADTSKKTVYVQLTVIKNNVNPANTPPVGKAVSVTGWKATGSSQYFSSYSYSKAIDGNTSTFWASNGSGLPQWFQVDMGTSRTIKGFTITTYALGGTPFGGIVEAEVLSSNDGVNWNSEGDFVGDPLLIQKNITFVNPVTARYFKLNITKTTDNAFASFAELKAFE